MMLERILKADIEFGVFEDGAPCNNLIMKYAIAGKVKGGPKNNWKVC